MLNTSHAIMRVLLYMLSWLSLLPRVTRRDTGAEEYQARSATTPEAPEGSRSGRTRGIFSNLRYHYF